MTNKIVYFVVGVNLETGTVFDDPSVACVRFPDGATWDEDEGCWEHETEEDFNKARDILFPRL